MYDAAFRATGWPGDFQSLLGLTAFFRRPTRQHIHSHAFFLLNLKPPFTWSTTGTCGHRERICFRSICKTIKNAQRVFAISAARRRIRSTRRLQIIRRSSIQPREGVAGIGRAESREGKIHRPMLENTVASDDGPRSAENGSVSERRSARRGSRRIAAEAEIIEFLQQCEGLGVRFTATEREAAVLAGCFMEAGRSRRCEDAGITKRVAFHTFRHTYTTCSHRTART